MLLPLSKSLARVANGHRISVSSVSTPPSVFEIESHTECGAHDFDCLVIEPTESTCLHPSELMLCMHTPSFYMDAHNSGAHEL